MSGQRESSSFDPNGEDFCGYGSHRVCTAAVWQCGKFINLPGLGGNNSTVENVNNLGQMPGVAETANLDSTCASSLPAQKLRYQAVIWGPNLRQVRPLPLLGSDTVSVALWMNDTGQAVGTSGNCGNTTLPPLTLGPHAIMWEKDGTPIDLRNLGTSIINVGLGINAKKWSALRLFAMTVRPSTGHTPSSGPGRRAFTTSVLCPAMSPVTLMPSMMLERLSVYPSMPAATFGPFIGEMASRSI